MTKVTKMSDIQEKYNAIIAHDNEIEVMRAELREATRKRIEMYDDLRDTVGVDNTVEVEAGDETVTLRCVHRPGFSDPVLYVTSTGVTRNGQKLRFGDDVSDEKIRRKK